MAQEIELKVALTEGQYGHILNLIQKKEKTDDFIFSEWENLYKKDEYYSRYDSRQKRRDAGEPKVIRLRCEKSLQADSEQTFFTIKNKSKKDGIEFNEEQETFVENGDVLRNFFEQTGFKKWFSKEKEAVSVTGRLNREGALKFHLELEKVNGLLYIEVEYTEGNAGPELVRSQLTDFVRKLGADPDKRDSRSWVEIISGCK